MIINASEQIERLSKQVALLEAYVFLLSTVSNDRSLEDNEDVQSVLSSFERFINDKR